MKTDQEPIRRNEALEPFRENLTKAFEATKNDHTRVVLALACDSTRVKAMAKSGLLLPDVLEALGEAWGRQGYIQLIPVPRDQLDHLFTAAMDVPIDLRIAQVIDALELAGWPLLIAVDDDGLSFHFMRDGELPQFNGAVTRFAWPERILDHERS